MKPAQRYIELFRQHEATIERYASPVLNAPRREALAAFERMGFPPLTHEDYRYTDVAQAFAPDYEMNIRRTDIQVNPYDVFHCDVPALSAALYFVVNDSFYAPPAFPTATPLPDGVYAGSLKTFAERYPAIAQHYYATGAPTGNDAIVALNTLLTQDGFALYVPHGVTLDRPIQLVNIFRSDMDTMAHRRVLVIMEPHSQAKLLVCDHSMDNARFLSTCVTEIFVGEGARFDYYDLEESHATTARFFSLHVRQEARSNVLVNGITLNNGLTRNNYHIDLCGEAAESMLCGMAALGGQQQVDTFSCITHVAPRCTSNELFKYVLDDRSVGAFSGRIVVKEGAQQTSAYQACRNLCATRDARMYAKPQLEIYADDVKCSHGMTTGQLDENALFYLQSRGIPHDEARTLLTIAFTADIVNNIRLDALKQRLQHLIEKRFRGDWAYCSARSVSH